MFRLLPVVKKFGNAFFSDLFSSFTLRPLISKPFLD